MADRCCPSSELEALNASITNEIPRPGGFIVYLTDDEVGRLIDAAKGNRHGHRDATMISVAYCHGLRASELTDLHWDQVEFASATLHVRRVKQGTPSTHPILGDEPEPYANSNVSKSQGRHLYSRQNAARRSPQQALLA